MGAVQVAILSLHAAGVGITLTAASMVIFAELDWTPGILEQAEDRAHRIGQEASVNIHYLLARGTIDDIIWQSIAQKVSVISELCDGHRDYFMKKSAASCTRQPDAVMLAAMVLLCQLLRQLRRHGG